MDWLDELLGQQDKQEFPELSPMAMQDEVAPTVSTMDLVPKFENKMNQAVQPKNPMQELNNKAPQSEMNPVVKDYLVNKVMPGKYSPENREALASESGEANPWALGLAGLGGALQDYGTGGKGSAMQNVMNLQKMAKDRKEGKLKEFDIMAEKEKTAKYDDPNSMESKQAQEIAVKFGISPDKVGSMSANRINELIPSMSKLMDIENQKQSRLDSKEERRFLANQAFQNKKDLADIARQSKIDEKGASLAEKKRTALLEVEDRRRNIEDNLSLLESQIKDKGTYEAFGSHNTDLERRIDAIATDMAKLADPSSVARPSEVEMFKKSLITPSATNMTNKTALQVLKNFRSEVNKRAENAYKIRGIDNPQDAQESVGMGSSDMQSSKQMTPKDEAALQWANSNPDDPRSAAILKRLGM